jgi:putative ABC transport system permease protein
VNPQIFRDGVRWLIGKPIPTLLAGVVLALALAIGTVAFSVLNAAILRPAPYKDASQIVAVSNFHAQRGSDFGVSTGRFQDFRRDNRSFEDVAAFRTFNQTFVLTGVDEPELLRGARISKGFFHLLGVNPALGRTFASETESEEDRSVILSYSMWCRRYACDPTLLGKPVVLDGTEYIVIGVMPRSFKTYFDRPMELWLPLLEKSQSASERGLGDLHILARLKKGITLQQAQTESAILDHRLAEQYPETDKDLSFRMSYWWPSITRGARPALAILSGAVALLLLIACSTMAFVQLAKAFSREKEISIRLACGASRLRLTGAFLVEGFLYGALAGGLGILFALLGTNSIIALVPESIYIPRLNETSLDGHVLAFSVAMAISAGLIFGLINAFSMIRTDPFIHLGGGAGAVIQNTLRKKVRISLVVLQMAVAIILTVGTGLMLKSLVLTTRVPLGFNSDRLLMSEIQLSPAVMSQPDTWRNYYREVTEKLTSTPGVESVAIVSPLPFGDEAFLGTISSPTSTNKHDAVIRYISAGFAPTLGLTLTQGRPFLVSDYSAKSEAVIVNETFVRLFWPEGDPVGKRISVDSKDAYTVVGVFKDFKDFNRTTPILPEIYLPFGKDVTPFAAAIVRIKSQDASFAAVVRDQIRSADRNQPLPKVRAMASFVSDDLASSRFFSVFLGGLACVALLLALIGIYATLSLSVGQRSREFAIRMALGADRLNVTTVVIKDSLLIIIAAEVLGITGALILAKFLSTLLFGVKSMDPGTLVVVALMCGTTALAASYAPTRAATDVDPAIILRSE